MTDLEKFFVGTVGYFLSTGLRGLVLKSLWGWFFVPFGLPFISIGHALGISCAVAYLTINPIAATNKEYEGMASLWISIILSAIVWCCGFVFQLFM